ncbi:MAG: transporter substrate-binding domain-containing protein [Humidesulfovibrio sp.]|uniref:substrate-binding periplasmic protein n=1 Tax=Humidesulfovibrio sp. TaxID=2910988 RepID=UPI0027F9200B|nr:transporter substrate-binding domain-containing protein [Humidesulfovibrio sp.]MDQ7834021.1 transporter substrate-binding domain-containing protein [Humidesulfovibrio sp.]
MRTCICTVIIVLFLFTNASFAQTLVLNTDDIYPRSTPDATGFEDLILKMAFRSIGLDIRVVLLPSERALINADQGIDDGNFARTSGVEDKYHNLVMVPAKICDFAFTAFVKNPDIVIKKWEDLKPYNVGMLNGWQYPERYMPKTKSLHKVRDDKTLFTLLTNDRVDVIIHEDIAGSMLIKSMGLTGVRAQTPALGNPDMYLYLNKKHAALVPLLSKALKQMDANGTRQAIIDRTLKQAGLQ